MRTHHYGVVSLITLAAALLVNACSGSSTPLEAGPGDTSPTDPNTPGSRSPETPVPPGPTNENPTPIDGGVATDSAVADGAVPIPVDGGVDSSTDGGPAGSCSASASADACYECCDTKNPGGWDVAQDAWVNCICTAPAVCAAACATSLCKADPTDPTPACETCLGSAPAAQCDTAAENACNASASCLAADQCVAASNCEAKP